MPLHNAIALFINKMFALNNVELLHQNYNGDNVGMETAVRSVAVSLGQMWRGNPTSDGEQ